MSLLPYAHLAARTLKSNFTRLDFPYKLTYATTYWCNYRCQTCNIWKMKPKDEMKLEEIRTFFKKAQHFLWVDLTGGEVSIRKDFVDICEAVVAGCPNLLLLHFPTNGYLTEQTVENVREISKIKAEKLIITVSMDGDEVTNDRIRGVDGGWQRQMETFRQLRDIPGVQVVLGMTLSQSNVNHFPVAFQAVKNEFPALTYNDYHVNIIHESEHFFGNAEEGLRKSVGKDDLSDAVEHYGKLRGLPKSPVSSLERAYLKRVRNYLDTGKTPIRCQALSASCFVDPWGNVFPCTIYNKQIGSLRDSEYDLTWIWNSPEAEALQKEIWEYQCPQCWTPCEAYQSILGSMFRKDAPTGKKPSASGENCRSTDRLFNVEQSGIGTESEKQA